MKNKISILIIVFCLLNVAMIGRAYPYALRAPIDTTYQRALVLLNANNPDVSGYIETIELFGIKHTGDLDFPKVLSAIQQGKGNLTQASLIYYKRRNPAAFGRLAKYGLFEYAEYIKREHIHSVIKQAGGNLTKAAKKYGSNNRQAFHQLAESYGQLVYANAEELRTTAATIRQAI